MGLPVVVVRGMLESGKTTFIKESLLNGDFGDLGKVLIVCNEEGETEISDAELRYMNAEMCIMEDVSEFNEEYFNNAIKRYKPNAIFIEVNEMWNFNELKLPSYLDVEETMGIIDGSTFLEYFNNMRQKFVDMVKMCQIVIINRCKPEKQTSIFKRNIKIINNAVSCIALDENNKELKLESDLPFDVRADIIKINRDDFGIFYIDTFDNKTRYEGKIVEFDCMAFFSKRLPFQSFVAGRMAMTCCANDIQLLGHLCAYKDEDFKVKNKDWIHLKAKIYYKNFKNSPKEQIILKCISYKLITPPSKDENILMLNNNQ